MGAESRVEWRAQGCTAPVLFHTIHLKTLSMSPHVCNSHGGPVLVPSSKVAVLHDQKALSLAKWRNPSVNGAPSSLPDLGTPSCHTLYLRNVL